MTVREADEARALIAALFSEGVAFTRGDYEAPWLRGQHVLDAMKQGGHTETLARLAGDFVLRAVQAAHHKLGVALGLAGSVRPPAAEREAPPPDRRALLDAVTSAIARYTHQVTAIDAEDPVAVASAVRALDPIVRFRAKARTTRGAADAEDDPIDDPVTPIVDRKAQPAVPANAPAANDGDAAKRRVA